MNNFFQKTVGLVLIVGLLFILLLSFFLNWNILTTIFFLLVWIFLPIIFSNPLLGFFIFLIIRPSIDTISNQYNLHLSENISINLASAMGIFVIFFTLFYIIKNRLNILKIPLFWIMIFFWLVVNISIFYSLSPLASIHESVRVLSIFSLFFLAYFLGNNFQNRKKIIKSILISACIPVIWAIIQLLTHSGLGGTSGIESRLYGTFVHPNSFASFLIIIFVLTFYFVWKYKQEYDSKKIYFWLYLGLLFIISFLLLETFSRGAWLAMLTFFLLFGTIRSPKIIVFLGGFLIFLFFTMPTFHDRIEDIYNPPADSSIVWRFQKWQRVFSVIKKHPWIGVGAGTEVLVHEKEYGYYAGNPYTHNDFLKIWLENGMLGLIAYLALIFSVIVQLIKKYYQSKSDNDKFLFLIAILLFLAELVFSMSSNIWRGTATMWILWAFLGTILSISVSSKKKIIY